MESYNDLIESFNYLEKEISTLKTAFILTNFKSIDKIMNKLFNNEIRKKFWIHFDTNLTQEKIAELAGTTQKTVSALIKEFTTLGFFKVKDKKVIRKFDYIPLSWIKSELLEENNDIRDINE